MSKDTGGSAFPNWSDNHYTEQRPRGGMTLRDYFAAKAMQAILQYEIGKEGYATVHGTAGSAYKIADAMLAERSK